MSRCNSYFKTVVCVALALPGPLMAKNEVRWYQPHYMSSVEEASNQLQFLSPRLIPFAIGPKTFSLGTGYSLDRLSEDKLGINLLFSKSGVEQKTQYFWSWTGGYDAPVSTSYKSDVVTSIVYAEIDYFYFWTFSRTKENPESWCVVPIVANGPKDSIGKYKNNIICAPSESDAHELADALATLTAASGNSLRTSSGMSLIETPEKDLQKHPDRAGCEVYRVEEGSPAAQAGVLAGEILGTVNGKVCTKDVITTAVADATRKPEGGVVHLEARYKGRSGAVDLRYPHVDANTAQLQRQLADLTRHGAASPGVAPSLAAATVPSAPGQRLGARVRAVTDADVAALGLPKAKGVVVTSIEKGGLADEMQMQTGDVIVEVNGSEIGDVDFLGQFVRSGAAKSFRIWRKGQSLQLTVPQSM